MIERLNTNQTTCNYFDAFFLKFIFHYRFRKTTRARFSNISSCWKAMLHTASLSRYDNFLRHDLLHWGSGTTSCFVKTP